MKARQAGFTYIEILIVLIVIGILFSISVASYSRVRQRTMDQRRKADLEDVRAALEQYRSVNSVYPTPAGTQGLVFGSSALTDGTRTYMQVIPQDPQYPVYQYYYVTSGDDYTLAAELNTPESPACAAPPGGDLCGQASSGVGCNYCIGSYGKK